MELTELEIHRLGKNPQLAKSRFVEEMWPLRPLGSLSEAYIETAYTLEFKRPKHPNGLPVTFEDIVKKYTEYLRMCQQQEREDRWIKGIVSFVKNEGYTGNYVNPKHERRVLRYMSNEPTDKGASGTPKSFGFGEQRTLPGSEGSDDRPNDGDHTGEGAEANP